MKFRRPFSFNPTNESEYVMHSSRAGKAITRNQVTPESQAKLLLKQELMRPSISSEDINAILENLLKVLYVQYGVSLAEHSDWVHTEFSMHYREETGVMVIQDFYRMLNSWALKNPLVLIPSEEEMQKIAEWHRVVAFRRTSVLMSVPQANDIQRMYVNNAFTQLENSRMFLSLWRKAGQPTEQGECNNLLKIAVHDAIACQKKNLDILRRNLHTIVHSMGPESIRARCEAAIAQEEGILHQLKIALRSAR